METPIHPGPVASRTLRTEVLRVHNVSVQFGGVVAVNNVSIDVSAGEIHGLIGPNGAGKTTLFDTISGLRRPTTGSISFLGKDVTGTSAVSRARTGMRRTFQRQQPFGWLSVEDNVLAALEWRGGGGSFLGDLVAAPARRRIETERREAVWRTIELCGLTDVAGVPAGRLPIGRARMVELARAIVDAPKLLLLDEPTSGLQASETERFGQIVQGLRADHGCSVLLVEHDVGFIMRHCDRITVLHFGVVIGEGAPEAVRSDPLVREAYLG